MDAPERPFAADYATTLDRLIDEAGEAQDGRAVRIFQRFREAPFRGFAALHPRPYDPGKSPLVDGAVLDQRWEEEASDLMERARAAMAALPANADPRSAEFFKGLTTVLVACFLEGPWAAAIRAEAFFTAYAALDNADPDLVRVNRAAADEEWAIYDMTTSVQVLKVRVDWKVEEAQIEDSARELATASKVLERATKRSRRAWTRLRASRRLGAPVAVVRPRARAHRRRRAAARASGTRSGQDPGGDDDPEPVGVPPSLPVDDQGAS